MKGEIVNIIKTEHFTGDEDIAYVKITKEILTPRKTYVKGEISGKYRGDRLFLDSQRPNMSLFDFEIYEAQVTCESKDSFRKNKPFRLTGKIEFPREKLPKNIPVSILANGTSYDVNILEPSLYDFNSIRKYRQLHGDEVYGNFKAYIMGFIFDYERHEVIVIEEYINYIPTTNVSDDNSPVEGIVVSGEIKNNGYKKTEVYNKGKIVTRYTYSTLSHKPSVQEGCLGGLFNIIAIVFGIIFLIILLPNFFYIFLIVGLMTLFYYLTPILKWIFRIIGVAFLIIIFLGMFTFGSKDGHIEQPVPKPLQHNKERFTDASLIPVKITNQVADRTDPSEKITDKIIKRFRIWNDYKGTTYEGYYTVKLSDFQNAHSYKNELHLNAGSLNKYDQIVFNLKEHDENFLNGVYNMLDSIQSANQLSKTGFAEMTVCMIQDIPYSLVLEQDCDAKISNDPFIRQWLSKPDRLCDPYQRFGINTPVEFVTNLKGDCDTRTLLLYTVLSHYNYDLVLLSSEIYKHSLLGINLPFSGAAYIYNGDRYVVWETTALQVEPGIINPEMADMNNWRISLKSKNK